MLVLVTTIFAASVLGSLHCAGMCGAFLAIAISSPGQKPKIAPQVAYHLGRLATYLALGTAAGALGKAMDLSGVLVGVGPVATGLAGATIVVFALVTLLRLRGVSLPMPPVPEFWRRWTSRGVGFAMNRPVVPRAAMIGLLTTMLPCGWLYAFVAAAAGTAHPVTGAVVMVAFWAGTLPMMLALGAGLRTVLGAFGSRLPQVTCLVLIGVGLFTLVGRSHLSVAALLDRATATADVGGATTTRPACCEPGGAEAEAKP